VFGLAKGNKRRVIWMRPSDGATLLSRRKIFRPDMRWRRWNLDISRAHANFGFSSWKDRFDSVIRQEAIRQEERGPSTNCRKQKEKESLHVLEIRTKHTPVQPDDITSRRFSSWDVRSRAMGWRVAWTVRRHAEPICNPGAGPTVRSGNDDNA
jgi:hypothetical protein